MPKLTPASSALNTLHENGLVTIAADNRVLLTVGVGKPDDKGKCEISYIDLSDLVGLTDSVLTRFLVSKSETARKSQTVSNSIKALLAAGMTDAEIAEQIKALRPAPETAE
jgi:hypothetical protein